MRTESVLVHPRTGEEIVLKRSGRKTLSVELRPDGSLLVRSPLGMPEERILSFLEGHRTWIESRRNRLIERIESMPSEPLSGDEIRKLADEAVQDIPKRVRHYAPLVGVTYGRITIRNQKTRWGSCSAKRNLNFNCLLMLTPPEVRDYVVVHELCHIREMNHSARFWAQVERVLPDYRVQVRWLRENGAAVMRRMLIG
ncbi:MAG: M48 family metallopeptidase [Lachnospiraceae bacterium]|nr:M48 family metallopeptidase [Lachnospiraceae bacterium]